MKIVSVEAWAVTIPPDSGGLMSQTGIGEGPTSRSAKASGYRTVPPYRILFSDNLETMLVRIVADDGTEGVGEAQAPIAPEVSQAVVRHLYAPLLLGEIESFAKDAPEVVQVGCQEWPQDGDTRLLTVRRRGYSDLTPRRTEALPPLRREALIIRPIHPITVAFGRDANYWCYEGDGRIA